MKVAIESYSATNFLFCFQCDDKKGNSKRENNEKMEMHILKVLGEGRS